MRHACCLTVVLMSQAFAQTPTPSPNTHLPLWGSPLAPATPEPKGPRPKGRPRAFLDEIGRAKLPDDAYKVVAVVGDLKGPVDRSVQHQLSVFTMQSRAGLTVSQAIEAAGGFGDFADSRHVGVWKNESGTFLIVDVRAIQNSERDAKDPVLEAGDIVVILQRLVDM
jgi:hypothetical protein